MDLIADDEYPCFTALPGGVSSDIWRVELRAGPACIKRALARLRVAGEWRAPIERGRFEVAWIETVAAIEPTAVPPILGQDAEAGLFVMAYLDPAEYPLWKAQLRGGIADGATAAAVGARLARIHAATAGDAAVAARFDTLHIFHPIRLEPYLLATARAHPDRARGLRGLAERTARTQRALVHGDVSPKNILIGPKGPVFLDSECAWYGDPAFDLAFCLNHLLLKCLWNPAARDGFLSCFNALAGAYLGTVDWEAGSELEARAATLLPALLLARVDGKSPVEYLTEEADKARVRRAARALLEAPVSRLADVRAAWHDELER